jgi:hypothetical protein
MARPLHCGQPAHIGKALGAQCSDPGVEFFNRFDIPRSSWSFVWAQCFRLIDWRFEMLNEMTPSYVRHLKNEAKKIARAEGITHVASLNRLAERLGYQNWSVLAKNTKPDSIPGLTPKPIVRRSKRRLVTHALMVENHMTFYPVDVEFAEDALRPRALLYIANWPRHVPLYVVVEWDSRAVLVGYSWEVNSFYRRRAGLEEWFSASQMLRPGDADPQDPQWDLTATESTDLVLKAARSAQSILYELHDDEPIPAEVSSRIRTLVSKIGTARMA